MHRDSNTSRVRVTKTYTDTVSIYDVLKYFQPIDHHTNRP